MDIIFENNKRINLRSMINIFILPYTSLSMHPIELTNSHTRLVRSVSGLRTNTLKYGPGHHENPDRDHDDDPRKISKTFHQLISETFHPYSDGYYRCSNPKEVISLQHQQHNTYQEYRCIYYKTYSASNIPKIIVPTFEDPHGNSEK